MPWRSLMSLRFSRAQRSSLILTLSAGLAAWLSLSGCGGGGGNGGGVSAQPTVTSVSVSCASSNIQVEGTDQCSATVQGTGNPSQAVTWSVNNIAGGNSIAGTVTGSGLYTAPDPIPSSGSTITITATSQIDSTKGNSAQISLAYPVPSLSTISPGSVSVGSPDTPLTLGGSAFSKAAAVSLDGNPIASAFVTNGTLTATLPANMATLAGNHTITVSNPTPGGGTSHPAALAVNNFVPVLDSVSPATLSVGSPDTQIALSGSGFLPTSTVTLNSALLTSTFVSAAQILATVPAKDLNAAVTLTLTVANPAPGGGSSNNASLTVETQSSPLEASPKDAAQGPGSSSFIYIIGAPTSPGVAAMSKAPRVRPLSSSTGIGWCSFGYSGTPQSTNGTCVGHVPWMFQMAPGTLPDNSADTANCGTASYLMVRSYFDNNQKSTSCQQNAGSCFDYPQWNSSSNGNNCTLSAQHINSLLQNIDPLPTSVTCNPAPATPSLTDVAFTITDECGSTNGTNNYSIRNGNIYANSSCLYYPGSGKSTSSQYFGPFNLGFSVNTLANIAAKEGFSTVQVGQGTADTSGLVALNSELENGYPVIVQVRYKMRVKQGTGKNATCLIDGTPVSGKCGGHFMVLVGIDGLPTDPTGNVYVNDPFPGIDGNSPSPGEYLAYTKAEFLASWGNNGSYYLVIRPKGSTPPVSLIANSLAFSPAKVDAPYSVTVAAAYGTPPYTFSTKTTDGSPGTGLPTGLAIDSSTGTISGTPTTSGTYSFYLQVSDSSAAAADALVSISIGSSAATLTITTPSSLPSGTAGIAYQQSLTASGGQAPYTWLITPSALPVGISLSPSGLLSGTPSKVGPYTFSTQVVDAVGISAQPKDLSITIFDSQSPPQIDSLTANTYTVGSGGNAAVLCTARNGGSSPLSYTWDASGCSVSGTGPSVTWTAPSLAGTYTITCSVTDASGPPDSRSIQMNVSSSPLSAAISPISGTSSVTQFTVTGSGATPNGAVTAAITLPDTTTSLAHTTADGKGNFSFGPFTETETGIYSEIDSDDKTGGKSLPLTWTVSPSAVPVVNLISPTTMPPDNTNHLLTIYGSSFQPGNVVQVNYTGSGGWVDARGNPPNIAPPSQMTININPGSTGDTIYVRVCESASQETSSTCSSGAQAIVVSASMPLVTGVSPSPVPALNGLQTLTINGNTFQNGATLTYHDPQGNSYPGHTTAFVNSTQIVDNAFNNANDSGNWTVTVVNPGGISSNTFTFTVTSATPAVTGVSPSPVPALNGLQTLTINGNTFQNGATLTYHDPQGNPYPGHTTAFVNSTQIVDYAFNNANDSGNWTVTVVNPGGISSNTISFTVK